ncbi:hypothetical protein HYX12_00295 [Candidatus Woesearchaeota archaeon]|nr:hypothetical protein [Candidatus Woesearchaeota archaeon]
MECREPNCTEQATTTWGGRKVCQDHYDKYNDEHESRIIDLNNAYD